MQNTITVMLRVADLGQKELMEVHVGIAVICDDELVINMLCFVLDAVNLKVLIFIYNCFMLLFWLQGEL